MSPINKATKDISQAKNPDQRGMLAALVRAADAAKQIAIQTNTGIVVVRNGVRMYVTAEQLRREQSKATDTQ